MEQEKVINTQKIVEETSEIKNEPLKGNNESNETISFGTNQKELMEVFSSSISGYNTVKQVEDQLNEQRNSMYNDINQIAYILTGKFLTIDDITEIKKLAAEKVVKEYSDDIIATIFKSAGIKFNIDRTKIKDDSVSDNDLIRALFESIIATSELDLIWERAMEEKQKFTKASMEQLDDILARVDMAQELTNIQEKIDNCQDPMEKVRLGELYKSIYSTLSLGIILDKVENKGLRQLQKECRKNYDKTFKKTRKILINEKNNYFLDIQNLESSMNKLYPEMKDEVRLFLYIIYREISKRKEVSAYLANFINYFVLLITKLLNRSFQNDEKMKEYSANIFSILQKLK